MRCLSRKRVALYIDCESSMVLIVITQEGRPLWTTIGQQISRWEHLHQDFEAEFEDM